MSTVSKKRATGSVRKSIEEQEQEVNEYFGGMAINENEASEEIQDKEMIEQATGK